MIDLNTLQELVLGYGIIALPLVVGLVEVVKKTTKVSERWQPLTSVIIGLLVGLIIVSFSITGAVVGVIIGLSATGLWEFGKTTIAGK